MDVQEELELFNRYTKIFTGECNSVLGITSVHLAQQLERYINPSLDLGWVIRCILDINSENLFTNSRGDADVASIIKSNSMQPEYKFAEFIVKLCRLFLYADKGIKLTEEQINDYILHETSEFYFGNNLSELNKNLLQIIQGELSVV